MAFSADPRTNAARQNLLYMQRGRMVPPAMGTRDLLSMGQNKLQTGLAGGMLGDSIFKGTLGLGAGAGKMDPAGSIGNSKVAAGYSDSFKSAVGAPKINTASPATIPKSAPQTSIGGTARPFAAQMQNTLSGAFSGAKDLLSRGAKAYAQYRAGGHTPGGVALMRQRGTPMKGAKTGTPPVRRRPLQAASAGRASPPSPLDLVRREQPTNIPGVKVPSVPNKKTDGYWFPAAKSVGPEAERGYAAQTDAARAKFMDEPRIRSQRDLARANREAMTLRPATTGTQRAARRRGGGGSIQNVPRSSFDPQMEDTWFAENDEIAAQRGTEVANERQTAQESVDRRAKPLLAYHTRKGKMRKQFGEEFNDRRIADILTRYWDKAQRSGNPQDQLALDQAISKYRDDLVAAESTGTVEPAMSEMDAIRQIYSGNETSLANSPYGHGRPAAETPSLASSGRDLFGR